MAREQRRWRAKYKVKEIATWAVTGEKTHPPPYAIASRGSCSRNEVKYLT